MFARSSRIALITALSCALLAGAVSAVAQPEAAGRFKDWSVFTETVDGELICFASTPASDKAPKAADHGDVYFYVSTWKSGAARAQPSLKVGFELRADLAPVAKVGRSAWTLFPAGRAAFAMDEDDPAIVRALKSGTELRIEAVSAKGTAVTYHFSLSGSSAAIDKAASLCR